jgi:hypothetical protein
MPDIDPALARRLLKGDRCVQVCDTFDPSTGKATGLLRVWLKPGEVAWPPKAEDVVALLKREPEVVAAIKTPTIATALVNIDKEPNEGKRVLNLVKYLKASANVNLKAWATRREVTAVADAVIEPKEEPK